MKQLIFTFLTTLCLTALPSASTPIAGLDDADTKSSAAGTHTSAITLAQGETNQKTQHFDVRIREILDTRRKGWSYDDSAKVLISCLQNGMSVNHQLDGRSLLWHMVHEGLGALGYLLVQFNADANIQNLTRDDSITPLAESTQRQETHSLILWCTCLLVTAGANVDTTINGKTILDNLLESPHWIYPGWFTFIIEAGNQNVLANGKSLETVAQELGNPAITKGLRYRQTRQTNLAAQSATIQGGLNMMPRELTMLINNYASKDFLTLDDATITSDKDPLRHIKTEILALIAQAKNAQGSK